MERWEYHILETKLSNQWRRKKRARETEELGERLDALGAEGWEMVGFNASVIPTTLESVGLCFFKRRVA